MNSLVKVETLMVCNYLSHLARKSKSVSSGNCDISCPNCCREIKMERTSTKNFCRSILLIKLKKVLLVEESEAKLFPGRKWSTCSKICSGNSPNLKCISSIKQVLKTSKK